MIRQARPPLSAGEVSDDLPMNYNEIYQLDHFERHYWVGKHLGND